MSFANVRAWSVIYIYIYVFFLFVYCNFRCFGVYIFRYFLVCVQVEGEKHFLLFDPRAAEGSVTKFSYRGLYGSNKASERLQ